MSTNHQNLIGRITESINGGTINDFDLNQLARDYADACKRARQRLDQCSALLAQGNDYAALQVAETRPPLLDLLATLSFGQLDEWNDRCRELGLPITAAFSETAVDKLTALYDRPVNEQHPLYKEYRKMRMQRNDRAALQALNQILRRNPDDKTARGEFQRLEGKIRTELLRDLDKVLQTVQPDQVIELMGEIEQIGWSIPLDGEPVWGAAMEKRGQMETENARIRLREVVQELGEAHRLQDYYGAEGLETECRQLQEQFGLNLSGEEADIFATSSEWLEASRRQMQQDEQFQTAINAWHGKVQALEEKPHSGGIGRAQLLQEKAELVRLYKRAESFGRPLSEDIVKRTRRQSDSLTLAISRKAKLRNATLTLSGLAVLALMITSIFFTLRLRTERELVATLSELREQQQAIALGRFLDKIEEKRASYLLRPKVGSQAAVARQWLDEQHGLAERLDQISADLRRTAEGNFQGPALLRIAGWFETLDTMKSQMAPDLFAERGADVLRIRNDWESFLRGERIVRINAFEQALKHAEALGRELTFSAKPEDVAERLNDLVPLVAELRNMREQQFDHLIFPEAIADRLLALDERVLTYGAAKESWRQALVSLEQASHFTAYNQALEKVAQSQFARDRRVIAAKKIAGQTEVFENWRQSLLMPNEPQAWTAFLASRALVPSTPLPPERQRFLNLLAEERYPRNFIQDHPGEGRLLRRWMGLGMVDRTRGVIDVNLLWLVDSLRKEEGINDLFRAYLHQKIGDVMEFRRHQWGLHFSPAFVRDLEDLKRIAGPVTASQYTKPMEHLDSLLLPVHRFYAERSTISYHQQALAFLDLSERVLESHMRYVGYVDSDGELRLTEAVAEGRTLWGIANGGDQIHPIDINSSNGLEILSPVFIFSYNGQGEQELLKAVFQQTKFDLTDSINHQYLPPLAIAGLPTSPPTRLSEEGLGRDIDAIVQAERDRLTRVAELAAAEQRRAAALRAEADRQERLQFAERVRQAHGNFETLRALLLGRTDDDVRVALGSPNRSAVNQWYYYDAVREGARRQILQLEFHGGRVVRVIRGGSGQ